MLLLRDLKELYMTLHQHHISGNKQFPEKLIQLNQPNVEKKFLKQSVEHKENVHFTTLLQIMTQQMRTDK